MTPTAVTHAGKGTAKRKAAGWGPRTTYRSAGEGTAAGHRRTAAGRAAPSAPGKATTSASRRARPSAPGRATPSAPRRVSGPLRGRLAPPRRTTRARRPANAPRPPLTVRAAQFVRTLPDHSLLDRVLRGRTWIALLGLMLVGIVAMQVEVLKLGASEGRALTQSAALQSKNEILRASVASESAEQRIEQLAAARYGMVMPDPTTVVFLPPNATANAVHAVHNISAPNPTEFLASLPAATANLAGSTGASDTGTGTTSTTLTTGPGTTVAPTGTSGAPDTGTVSTTPSTGTPAAGTPAAGTPVTGTPSTGTPTTATPVTTPPAGTAASTTGGAAIGNNSPAG
jgi:cell division protein FtsL